MILVTGSTGLLGSHLLVELAKHNEPIRALYRSEKKKILVQKLFHYYFESSADEKFHSVEWVQGDVLDIISLQDALQGIDKVYHCAAIVSFNRKEFQQIIKVNREGTANMVNFSLDAGVKKFLHVSSTAAIGGEEGKLVTEETKWKLGPTTSGYSVSKYSSEKEVWRGIEEGLNAVIINPCVILGPGCWNDSSLTILRSVNKGLKFYTPGQNAIVDARDVASCSYQLMESKLNEERYLCIGENVPFKILLSKIAARLGKKAPSWNTPSWLMGFAWRLAGFVAFISRSKPTITKETAQSAFKTMEYSNDKIRKALDYSFYSLDDTIDNAIKGKIDC